MTEPVTEIREPTATGDEAFWYAAPELQHVLTFARARHVSPWAMLGAVLARLDATIPPNVVLPPLIGSHGSLNLFVGIVARSGGGKGASERAAADAFHMPDDIYTSSIGSGEGLLHMFAHYDKDEDGVVMHRESVLLSVPEVDSLTALGGRQGATLLPTLRSAFTGEMLAPGYANREKAIRLEGHSYRLALVMGIQPGRARALLDDADGGTPQRFLWLPGTDPDAPDIPPAEPDPLRIEPQRWPDRLLPLSVDGRIREQIVRQRVEVLRGNIEPSHLMFVRLKVAALLTILGGRRSVTRDDWSLSRRVIAISESTRRGVAEHLENAAARTSRARGRLDGERRAAAHEAEAEASLRRICQWALRRLGEAPDGMTAGSLRKAARSTDREIIGPALDALTETGAVVKTGDLYLSAGDPK